MLTSHQYLPAALLAAVVGMTAPACASQGALYRRLAAVPSYDARAYEAGYQEGRVSGEGDARRQRRVDYARHGTYRSGSQGYRGYGNREAYRDLFRRGFIAGYDDGYRRYANGAYGAPGTAAGRYPGARPNGRFSSPAAENGYRDGYVQGRQDANDGDRYDPRRAMRYRSGDDDYDSRYGSRDAYAREYRGAFQQGYEQGFRQYRR